MEPIADTKTELIDYDLPESLIAQEPLAVRSNSRLLCLNRLTGAVQHLKFTDFARFLHEGDVLVLNETRVTAIRLYGQLENSSGKEIEALLIRQLSDLEFECLMRPAKVLKVHARICFGVDVFATVISEGQNGLRILKFDSGTSLRQLENLAYAPIPPYIKTPLLEKERYQTVYAQNPSGILDGSAAAPTAGLHFTEPLLAEIAAIGVIIAKVNLTVGLDTFRPIKDLSSHAMHGEQCSIDEATCDLLNNRTGKLWAVGTTSARTLESFARTSKLSKKFEPGTQTTKLFLKPGNQFLAVEGLLTNFHMPRTTMLLMIAAFASVAFIKQSYWEAVQQQYRFLSFGDSMLIY